MCKHVDRIFFFDRVLLLTALRSPFFTSQQVMEVSLVMPAGLLSLGISSVPRLRVSTSLHYLLNMSDVPLNWTSVYLYQRSGGKRPFSCRVTAQDKPEPQQHHGEFGHSLQQDTDLVSLVDMPQVSSFKVLTTNIRWISALFSEAWSWNWILQSCLLEAVLT